MGVAEIDKPRGAWCPHCERGKGCGIYADRPGGCRAFLCGWLTNPRFGPEWKPDRSKIVITVGRDGNGLGFQCDPGFPEAWRKEPYYGQIKSLAAIAARHDGLISVNLGRISSLWRRNANSRLAKSATRMKSSGSIPVTASLAYR
jgi:hypothetical protein